jgi:hypothetical protein
MAIIDVYDALVNKRVYKPAFTHEEAFAIMLEERNTHFDPNCWMRSLRLKRGSADCGQLWSITDRIGAVA